MRLKAIAAAAALVGGLTLNGTATAYAIPEYSDCSNMTATTAAYFGITCVPPDAQVNVNDNDRDYHPCNSADPPGWCAGWHPCERPDPNERPRWCPAG